MKDYRLESIIKKELISQLVLFFLNI